MSTQSRETVRPESIVDALLPNESDESLEALASTTFIDDAEQVPVSPLDQLLMALARRLLVDAKVARAAVIQLPRADQRSAFLLAICSHLLCRRPPTRHRGPVVLIGFDVDVTSQLKDLGVQNRRRMGLADGNPLSLHRLTRAGGIRPAVGAAVGLADQSLLYLNTRVGQPQLNFGPPLVILDATTVAHPTARRRALKWALDHNAAAIVAVGDLGDDGLVESVTSLGINPTVLPITDEIVGDLIYTFGRGEESLSSLSSMSVLVRSRTSVRVHPVSGDEINEAVARAFASLVGRPSGAMPAQLSQHLNLLRNGARIAAQTADYRAACTHNPRPGEMPLLRLLDRPVQLPRNWKAWGTARLGSLKAAVRTLWRVLDEENPKLLALWRLLDRLDVDTDGELLIRCHSRAAAEALRVSLCDADRTPAQQQLWSRVEQRVKFATLKQRFPAGSFEAQVLTGAPPPWLFSHFLNIEAVTTHVLAYGAEALLLGRQGERWSDKATAWHHATCRHFGAQLTAATTSPIPTSETGAVRALGPQIRVPGLSLAEVLDLAEHTLDPTDGDTDTPGMVSGAGSGVRRCIPVHLADGRTWWRVAEEDDSAPVLVVTAGGHEHRPVVELRQGDRILVPAGDGTDSIHARLVSASRKNDDVRSLDLILSQFRSAARSVLTSSTSTSHAVARVEAAGAEASGQLPAWARGTTIAPREPHDVAAVFRAADHPCPDLGLIYAVASRLRGLSRTLGRFVAAIAAGGEDQAIDKLRELVGPVADELLDEFVIADVDSVGEPRTVSASIAGQIR